MRKLTAIIMCVALILMTIPVNVFAEDSKGLTEGVYTYDIENGVAEIVGCDTSVSGELTVPETLGGYPVTSLEKFSFKDCTGISSVTINKNVIRIHTETFVGCDNIERFIVAEGNTYFSTDECGVLYYKTALKCFPAGSGIENYTVPDGITHIRANFDGCDSLKTLTIPESVEHISCNFSNCTNLTDIYYGGIENEWIYMDGVMSGMPDSINVHCREMTLKEKLEYASYSLGSFMGPVMFFGFYFVIGIPFYPFIIIQDFVAWVGDELF